MISTITIDSSILDIPSTEDEADLLLQRVNSFFSTITKQTVWIDCIEEGAYNTLSKKYLDLKDVLEDEPKKKLEILWKKFFWDKQEIIDSVCDCSDCKKCSVINNVKAINQKNNDLPHYIVTFDSSLNIPGINTINMNKYDDSELYHKCLETSYSCSQPSSVDDGMNKIISFWSNVLKLQISYPEVVLIDRNVFEKWNDNYQNGLKQFADAISLVNNKVKFTLITRLASLQVSRNNNETTDDRYSKISTIIENISNLKVELIFCNKSSFFTHERYITLNNILGAELNRGLDTFIPNNSQDSIKIIYEKFEKIQTIMNEALANKINSGKYQPINNKK